MQATHLLQFNNPPQYQSSTSQYKTRTSIEKKANIINQTKVTQQIYIAQSNTPNINLYHLITSCKPPACSNTTTHHKTNYQHHNI